MLAAPVAARLDGLYERWAQKEAVIKALGAGVSFGMARVEARAGAAGAGTERRGVAVDGVEGPAWLCVPRA